MSINTVIASPPAVAASQGIIRNVTPRNIRRLAAGANRVRTKTGSCRLGDIGDSTTAGYKSLGNVVTANQFQSSSPSQLVELLKTVGIDAMNQNRISTGGPTETIGASDDIVLLSGGTGWVMNGSTLGGNMFTGTAAGTLTYTSKEPIDTFDLYYVDYATTGTISYSINGGAATQLVLKTAGGNTVKKLTLPLTKGINSIAIAWVSGTCLLCSFCGVDSTRSVFNIFNMGCRSLTAAGFSDTSTPYRPLPAVPAYSLDAAFLNFMINDAANVTITKASYKASMQAIITALLPTTDVILRSSHHCSAGFSANMPEGYAFVDQMQRLVDAMVELSNENGIPYIDNYSNFADYASYANAPLQWFSIGNDAVHPIAIMYRHLAIPARNLIQLV